jgi:hypothetical protein
MDADSLQARIEHETAELRALYPYITDCHSAMIQWKEGADSRYSVRLDIRWAQHQTLISGEAKDGASAALAAGFEAARRQLDSLPRKP